MEKKDKDVTEVIFRVWKSGSFKGEVTALFPYEFQSWTNPNSVLSYERVGQHSTANYAHMIDSTRAASEEEYADLKKELEGVGYNLKVVKMRNRINQDRLWQDYQLRMKATV